MPNRHMYSPEKWLYNRIYCLSNRSKQIQETHTAYNSAGTQYTRQSLNEKQQAWLYRQTVIVCGAMEGGKKTSQGAKKVKDVQKCAKLVIFMLKLPNLVYNSNTFEIMGGGGGWANGGEGSNASCPLIVAPPLHLTPIIQFWWNLVFLFVLFVCLFLFVFCLFVYLFFLQ